MVKQRQKRILIIDDEQDIVDIFRISLEDNGFKTDTYTDPLLAYQNFRDGKYDLVILDIKMPGFDGFNLYEKIKRTDGKVKIIFLTASEYYYEQLRNEQGFNNFNQEIFLRKPIQIKDLVHKIEKLLDSPSSSK